jgi:BMFP domain-containing protein YqiC
MTGDVADMSTPVTRGELRDELAQLESRVDDKLDRLERKFDNNLCLWGEALAAQIRESAAQTAAQMAAQMAAQIRESEKRLLNELARHVQAVFESMTKMISVVDEKYNDLPARVARLEADART